MDKRKKLLIASAIGAALVVLFPQSGETVLYVLQTFLGLVPQLTLRPV